ncbi:hypothetical protein HN935_00015 [archaeon]|jgi:hypothetical protein|nr:hypothetical protein [archaeon]
MWSFKKRKDKIKTKLQEGALRELSKLKREKLSSTSIEELNKIFHVYLKEKYKIKQSLTYEELAKKIKSKKINHQIKLDIFALASKIQTIEYNSGEVNKKIFNNLIKETKALIRN